MTVAELMERLKEVPEDLPVCVMECTREGGGGDVPATLVEVREESFYDIWRGEVSRIIPYLFIGDK